MSRVGILVSLAIERDGEPKSAIAHMVECTLVSSTHNVVWSDACLTRLVGLVDIVCCWSITHYSLFLVDFMGLSRSRLVGFVYGFSGSRRKRRVHEQSSGHLLLWRRLLVIALSLIDFTGRIRMHNQNSSTYAGQELCTRSA